MKVVVTKTLKNVVKIKYDNGVLNVVANFLVSRKRLRKIIEENSAWINAKKEKEASKQIESEKAQKQTDLIADEGDLPSRSRRFLRNIDGQDVREIFAGRKTVIMGDVVDVVKSMSNKTYLDGSSLYISEKLYADRTLRVKAIKAYLRKTAGLYVASEVASFGSGVSLCPAKIEFKDVPEGWVKCSLASERVLCLDYRITQLPLNLRTYLIAHAFAHFYIPTHDENFWNYISNLMPRYEDYRKQLEKYDFLKDI